jgi:hypothetical protein
MRARWLTAGLFLMGPISPLPAGCYSHANVGPAQVQAYRGQGISLQVGLALPGGLLLRDGQLHLGPVRALVIGQPGANSVLLDFDWK